jgi:multicomponent Na+:H+ antiporter subunit D
MAAAFRHYGPQGRLAATWSTRSMALWVLVLLLGYLLLYYV